MKLILFSSSLYEVGMKLMVQIEWLLGLVRNLSPYIYLIINLLLIIRM